MTIAVVGDVHGHLALLFAILGRWQREHGETIDVILQVGDLGAFLPTSFIDSATRRHAERDPEELGFGEFAGASPPRTALDPRPPLIFIPGNHEDFEYLDERERQAGATGAVYPVSQDGRILALRSGRVLDQRLGEESIRIAGISGVSGRERKRARHPRVHLDENEVLALAARGPGAAQILLTHEAPTGLAEFRRHGVGSEALRLLVEELRPALAFFGHHGESGEWMIGATRVVALADCGYPRMGDGRVARDAIAIVRWEHGCRSVDYVRDDWLREATRTSWRRW